jgi:signal transduction histidine kinase
MILRQKLRYQFNLIVFTILAISLLSIYIAFYFFKQEQFHDLLYRKAKTAAILLTDLEEINPTLLRKLKVYSASTLSSENVLIYDMQHKLVFHNNTSNWPVDEAFLKKVEKEKIVKLSVGKYEGLAMIYTGKKGRVIAVAFAQDDSGNKTLARLQAILLTVLVISLIVIIIAGRFYVDKSLQPINNLIAKVNLIGVTNLSERIETGNRTDEIAKLSKAFNSMLNRMEAAFQSQKLFIANASHELRTPLTVISGQLDVLMLKTRSVDEYKHTIGSIHKDILSLIRTANRLLTLAHASSGFSEVRHAPMRIDDAIWTAREELRELYPDAKVNVNFSDKIHEDAQIKLTGNEMLLTAAFLNLMENGCKYSRNKKIEVFLEAFDDKMVIKFIDHGIGIKTEEIDHLFEPFYRGSNTQGFNGQGIGLSIVNKVIALHHGEIKVNSIPGKGSEFIISLPLTGSEPIS